MATKRITKSHRGSTSVKIQLELENSSANEVCIAGSFNDWHPTVTPMISVGGGKWRKELALQPGNYEYRFVVDGSWIEDPAACENVSNPYGGRNSVLHVA